MPGAQYRFLSQNLTAPVFLSNEKATIVAEKKQDSISEQYASLYIFRIALRKGKNCWRTDNLY